MNGGDKGDILLAGPVLHESNAQALFAILSAWNSNGSYVSRASDIRSHFLPAGPTQLAAVVFDDTKQDRLTGSGGLDWYFANLTPPGVKVKLIGRDTDEKTVDLAFLNLQ